MIYIAITLIIANLAWLAYHIHDKTKYNNIPKLNETDEESANRVESNIKAHEQAFKDSVMVGSSFIRVEINEYGYPVHVRVDPKEVNLAEIENDDELYQSKN